MQSFALAHGHLPHVPFGRQHWPALQSPLPVQAQGPQLPSARQHWPAVHCALLWHAHSPHLPSAWQHLPAVQSLRLWHLHSPHLPSPPQHWPARQSPGPVHLQAPHLPSAPQHSPALQSCGPAQAQGPQTPPGPQHWPAVHWALLVHPQGPQAPSTPQHSPARQSLVLVHLHGPHLPSAPQHWPALQSELEAQPHSPHLPPTQHWPARQESFEVQAHGPQLPPLQHSPARQSVLPVQEHGLQRLSAPQHSPARQSAAARQHGWQVLSAAQQVPAPHSASLQHCAGAQKTACGTAPESGGPESGGPMVVEQAHSSATKRAGRGIGCVQDRPRAVCCAALRRFSSGRLLRGMLGLLLVIAVQATDAERAADARFSRGVALAGKGDYRAALVEFEEAYRLAPAWQVLFNLGVVREKLGEPVAALEAFEAYLEQGGDKVPREKAKGVEQELATLRREVSELVVKVEGAPAVVEVDGIVRAATPLYVLPGRHAVVARRDGQEARAEVELHRGDRLVVALVVPAAPVAAPVVEERPEPVVLTPSPKPERAVVASGVEAAPAVKPWYQRWYVWTVVGVVVAGSVTAVAVAATRPGYDVRVDAP